MPLGKDSEVLSMLQPDLLTKEELIQRIQTHFVTPSILSILLPCKTVRALQVDCIRYSLEKKRPAVSTCHSRLKPPPDISTSHKIRINSHKSRGESEVLDNIIIKDRRKSREDEGRGDERQQNSRVPRSDSCSGKKIALKRSSGDEKPSLQSPTESKKQRSVIKWP